MTSPPKIHLLDDGAIQCPTSTPHVFTTDIRYATCRHCINNHYRRHPFIAYEKLIPEVRYSNAMVQLTATGYS